MHLQSLKFYINQIHQFIFHYIIFLIFQNNYHMSKVIPEINSTQTQSKDKDIQNKSSPQSDTLEHLDQKLSEMTIAQKSKQGQDSLEQPKSDEHHEEQQEYFTRDLIDISKPSINFTKAILFPGSIDEVDVVISLKDEILSDEDPKTAYLLRAVAICHNSEFSELDQYVFSVRSNDRFEYFEQVRFRIRKKEKATVKVAVKVPPVKQSQLIEGTLSIQLQNTVPVFLQIHAKCQIPKILCLKDLYNIQQNTQVIKIPAKKNMRMPPVPFKNISTFNFIVQIETITSEDFSKRPYDIISQNTVNCVANTPFFINLQLKPNMNYRGITPKTDTIRKILILKVKNSSVHYSYPIQVFVYQSTNTSTMS